MKSVPTTEYRAPSSERLMPLATQYSVLTTCSYHATATAVTTKFAIASGNKNFQPNDINWS